MFAGSCIGVVLLVVSLEFLRRLSKEYDRYILRQFERSQGAPFNAHEGSTASQDGPSYTKVTVSPTERPVSQHSRFRPNILQQAVRATLHMVQFAIAYFVMLLAMYYNGYFIICIVIGAWIGAFVFSWEDVSLG
jgi:copper transporter 1